MTVPVVEQAQGKPKRKRVLLSILVVIVTVAAMIMGRMAFNWMVRGATPRFELTSDPVAAQQFSGYLKRVGMTSFNSVEAQLDTTKSPMTIKYRVYLDTANQIDTATEFGKSLAGAILLLADAGGGDDSVVQGSVVDSTNRYLTTKDLNWKETLTVGELKKNFGS